MLSWPNERLNIACNCGYSPKPPLPVNFCLLPGVGPTLTHPSVVGRNGMHHYNNQDHSMMTALLAAHNIATGSSFDPWRVNTDAEYHEETGRDADDQSGRLVPRRTTPVTEQQ